MRTSGASAALHLAYSQNGTKPVAFLDETYNVDPAHRPSYYVMVAVVVQSREMSALRSDLVNRAGASYWHTTEALRTELGRERTVELLQYLGDPAGSELCALRHESTVDPMDKNGEAARARCLRRLLEYLSQPGIHGDGVDLFVLERRRNQAEVVLDGKTKAQSLREGKIGPSARLMQVTPGEEQLLWLPDLVCSAYRQVVARGDQSYFDEVGHITTLI
jgi:hypothetical protein